MNRRGFLGMAAASIFVPHFGRFFREGSGTLWTPWRPMLALGTGIDGPGGWFSRDTRAGLLVCGDHANFDLPFERRAVQMVGPGPHVFPVGDGRVKIERSTSAFGYIWRVFATEGVIL